MPSGELGSPTAVAALCRRLARDAVSGTVRLEGPSGRAQLGLHRGELWWARSPGSGAALGDRLVEAGLVEEPELEELREHTDGGTDGHLIRAAARAGLVAPDVLELFVREQLFEAVLELLGWDEGTWTLVGDEAPAEDPPTTQPVPDLLMEVSRRRSGWEQLEPLVPGPDAVPSSVGDGDALAAPLHPDEFTVVANVDGRRSLRRLAADLGQEPFAVARTVYGLGLLGIVTVRAAATAGASDGDRDPWAGVASEADEPEMWVAADDEPPPPEQPGPPDQPREPAATADGSGTAGTTPEAPAADAPGAPAAESTEAPAAGSPEAPAAESTEAPAAGSPEAPAPGGSREPTVGDPAAGGDGAGDAAGAARPDGGARRRRSAGEVSELLRELSRLSQDEGAERPGRPGGRTSADLDEPEPSGDGGSADGDGDDGDDGDDEGGGRRRRGLFGWGR